MRSVADQEFQNLVHNILAENYSFVLGINCFEDPLYMSYVEENKMHFVDITCYLHITNIMLLSQNLQKTNLLKFQNEAGWGKGSRSLGSPFKLIIDASNAR